MGGFETATRGGIRGPPTGSMWEHVYWLEHGVKGDHENSESK